MTERLAFKEVALCLEKVDLSMICLRTYMERERF